MRLRAAPSALHLRWRLIRRGFGANGGGMIVFNLQCGDEHAFEAWFKDARAYDSQRKARKVACPTCGSTRVSKLPAARISKGAAARGDRQRAEMAEATALRQAVSELHARVAESCDNVGPRFAEEARKIHYGETEARGIYGEASLKEAGELVEEGVPVLPLPSLPESDA